MSVNKFLAGLTERYSILHRLSEKNTFHNGVLDRIKYIPLHFLVGFTVNMTNGITHTYHRSLSTFEFEYV
jgi:hypothetical protein